MTKDTLTLGSTDLLALAETVEVTVKGPPSERYEHSYTYDYLSLSRTVVIPDCRCSVINIKDLIKRALRTYPKRMSRAKRKEARARERRRVERYNQWWSKR